MTSFIDNYAGEIVTALITMAIFFTGVKCGLDAREPEEEEEVKDQHKHIKGYRDLSPEEIDLMNEGKALEMECMEYIDRLQQCELTNKRSVALGQTNLQQGFMWAIRGVARPNGE